MLGTSDAWSTSHSSRRTSEPAYYIVDCRIYTLGYLLTKQNLSKIPLIDTSLAHIIADINKMYEPIHCYERNEIWACKACVQSKNTYICYVVWA